MARPSLNVKSTGSYNVKSMRDTDVDDGGPLMNPNLRLEILVVPSTSDALHTDAGKRAMRSWRVKGVKATIVPTVSSTKASTNCSDDKVAASVLLGIDGLEYRSLSVENITTTSTNSPTTAHDAAHGPGITQDYMSILSALAERRSDPSLVVIVLLAAEDVLVVGNERQILRSFQSLMASVAAHHASAGGKDDGSVRSPARILFGTQKKIISHHNRHDVADTHFQDTFSFMGRAGDVHAALAAALAMSTAASESIVTNLFSLYQNTTTRAQFGLCQDDDGALFKNLWGIGEDGYLTAASDTDRSMDTCVVDIDEEENSSVPNADSIHDRPVIPREPRLRCGTATPLVIRGGGNDAMLAQIGNYVPGAWIPGMGCKICPQPGPNTPHKVSDVDNTAENSIGIATSAVAPISMAIKTTHTSEDALPAVYVTLFVHETAPFLNAVLHGLSSQNYPAKKLHFRAAVAPGPSAARYWAQLEAWLASIDTRAHFATAKMLADDDNSTVSHPTRSSAANALKLRRRLLGAVPVNTRAVLHLSSEVGLTEAGTLRALVSANRSVVAPAVAHEGRLFSNWWGAAAGDTASAVPSASSCRDHDAVECATHAKTESSFCEQGTTLCPYTCGTCQPTGAPLDDVTYLRAHDYLAVAQGKRRGIWAVAHVYGAVLVRDAALGILRRGLDALARATTIEEKGEVEERGNHGMEESHFASSSSVACRAIVSAAVSASRSAFSVQLFASLFWRSHGVYLHVDNRLLHGYLIDAEGHDHEFAHPELHLMPGNPTLWGSVYVHAQYAATVENVRAGGQLLATPEGGLDANGPRACADIYSYPLFSATFCEHIVAEAEHHGGWSNGGTRDPRLSGGYENVPTRDIHLGQLGPLGEAWGQILRHWVAPVAEAIWPGYTLEGRRTLDFVVRYRPGEQTKLRLHHDASTVTINVALNAGSGQDYSGGGTRFPRHNCTVLNHSVGHALMQPGRLTHQHEGLETTAGTRYILISFIDQP